MLGLSLKYAKERPGTGGGVERPKRGQKRDKAWGEGWRGHREARRETRRGWEGWRRRAQTQRGRERERSCPLVPSLIPAMRLTRSPLDSTSIFEILSHMIFGN